MELDWTTAQPAGDTLRIALKNVPDAAWAQTFDDAASLWQAETRGQTWDGVELETDGRGVVVSGIDPETQPHAIRTYLTHMVEAVDRDAEQARARHAGEEAREHGESQRREDAVSRLAENLRLDS
jgi:hypothetical protein